MKSHEEKVVFSQCSQNFVCRDELSDGFLRAHARLSGGGVGVRRHAVLSEDRFELLQLGVGSNPRWVEVGPTHPEAGLHQVQKELVQPVVKNRKIST